MFFGLSDLLNSVFVASKWLAILAALKDIVYFVSFSLQSGFSRHLTISSILFLTDLKFYWLKITQRTPAPAVLPSSWKEPI